MHHWGPLVGVRVGSRRGWALRGGHKRRGQSALNWSCVPPAPASLIRNGIAADVRHALAPLVELLREPAYLLLSAASTKSLMAKKVHRLLYPGTALRKRASLDEIATCLL
eukprot:1169787-Pleurochrysis_carterae.AAC.1